MKINLLFMLPGPYRSFHISTVIICIFAIKRTPEDLEIVADLGTYWDGRNLSLIFGYFVSFSVKGGFGGKTSCTYIID
jgi:hypothetical protein